MSQPRDDRQDDLFRPSLEMIMNLRHPLAWISTEPNSPNLTPARLHILWAFSPCSVMLNGALIAFLRGVTWPHVFTFRGISSVLVGEVALR